MKDRQYKRKAIKLKDNTRDKGVSVGGGGLGGKKKKKNSIHVWLKLHSLCLSISNSNWFEFFLSFTVEINVLKYSLDIGKASITSFTYSQKQRHSWIYSGLPLWECIFILPQGLCRRASRIFKHSVCCCSSVCTCTPISPLNLLGTHVGWGIGTNEAVDEQGPLAFFNYWYFYTTRHTKDLRQERLFLAHLLKMAQWQSRD